MFKGMIPKLYQNMLLLKNMVRNMVKTWGQKHAKTCKNMGSNLKGLLPKPQMSFPNVSIGNPVYVNSTTSGFPLSWE
jgi:hypothetical protein